MEQNNKLTHMNEDGFAKMVDVSEKVNTMRSATASGKIFMKKETINLITNNEIKKGDVLAVAQVAGIMGAKNTEKLIPMCHSLSMTGCDIRYKINDNNIQCSCTSKVVGNTGVEMEAIVGVTTALMTIYDMCKAVDKDMRISDIVLDEKIGGKSGHYKREKE